MRATFFPYPFPVQTPLGEGYALYVVPAPMFENDAWCVVLDDGRLLHFSTNQLRYLGNGTYDLSRPSVVHLRVGARAGCSAEAPSSALVMARELVTCPECLKIAP